MVPCLLDNSLRLGVEVLHELMTRETELTNTKGAVRLLRKYVAESLSRQCILRVQNRCSAGIIRSCKSVADASPLNSLN